MIKKFNVTKPEKYTAKDGNEKTIWHNIGTLTEFTKDNGQSSMILEIPAIGLKANVFPMEKKVDGEAKANKDFAEMGQDVKF
jgi:hypothetical protein